MTLSNRNSSYGTVTSSSGLLLALVVFGLISLAHQRQQHIVGSQENPLPGSSWDEVPNLDRYDPKSLKKFITPLVSISRSTYRSFDVPDWHKLRNFSQASDAGSHAVLYREDSAVSEKRLVLGFRGTYSMADACVDSLYFGETSPPTLFLPSPSRCLSAFSNQSLDYLSQSVSYTREVVKDFPGAPLLLTGHSLGAALAALVSVSLAAETGRVIPVVGFSAPGARNVLQSRGVESEHRVEGSIVVIGDNWDLVVRSFWEQRLGTVCLLMHEEPSECEACTSGNRPDACLSCGLETHELKLIMRLLDQGVTINCTNSPVAKGSINPVSKM